MSKLKTIQVDGVQIELLKEIFQISLKSNLTPKEINDINLLYTDIYNQLNNQE